MVSVKKKKKLRLKKNKKLTNNKYSKVSPKTFIQKDNFDDEENSDVDNDDK